MLKKLIFALITSFYILCPVGERPVFDLAKEIQGLRFHDKLKRLQIMATAISKQLSVKGLFDRYLEVKTEYDYLSSVEVTGNLAGICLYPLERKFKANILSIGKDSQAISYLLSVYKFYHKNKTKEYSLMCDKEEAESDLRFVDKLIQKNADSEIFYKASLVTKKIILAPYRDWLKSLVYVALVDIGALGINPDSPVIAYCFDLKEIEANYVRKIREEIIAGTHNDNMETEADFVYRADIERLNLKYSFGLDSAWSEMYDQIYAEIMALTKNKRDLIEYRNVYGKDTPLPKKLITVELPEEEPSKTPSPTKFRSPKKKKKHAKKPSGLRTSPSLSEEGPSSRDSRELELEEFREDVVEQEDVEETSSKSVSPVFILPYTERVTRWFTNPQEALKDPKYARIASVCIKNRVVIAHAFTTKVDNYLEKLSKEVEYSSGSINKIIPAKFEYEDGTSDIGVISYAFNKKTGNCYHRCFSKKSQNSFVEELLDKGRFAVEFPPLIEQEQISDTTIEQDGSFVERETSEYMIINDVKNNIKITLFKSI